jgi:hypothetical protein
MKSIRQAFWKDPNENFPIAKKAAIVGGYKFWRVKTCPQISDCDSECIDIVRTARMATQIRAFLPSLVKKAGRPDQPSCA